MTPSRLSPIVALGLLVLGSLSTIAPPSSAQSRPRRSRVKFVMPRLTYDRGAPSKRSEGGSRNNFCDSPVGPTALTPQYSETRRSSDGTPLFDMAGNPRQQHFVLTQTSEPQPTFALHMPLAKQDVADLKLNLFVVDQAGNEVYDLPIPVPSQAGIITFKPDRNQAALEEGQRYNWAIEIEFACTDNDLAMPKYGTLQGQIERQALFQENTLMSHEGYAIAAAEKGFWPDAMATVADLHRQDRSDEQYIADWTALLDSIGLEALSIAPLSETTLLLQPRSIQASRTGTSGTARPRGSSSRLFPVR